MKIGVLGGTFNPIHMAHVNLAKQYFSILKLDKLIFIPTFIPPHKPAKNLASAKQRLEMCRLAVKDYPGFEACDYEIRREGKSYTYLTLQYLSGIYPAAEIFLIMGADMFLTMRDWKYPEKIFALATLCVAGRAENEVPVIKAEAERLREDGARCMLLDMEPLPMSSTAIRGAIAAKSDVSGLLHPDVLSYIERNGLYTG